MASETPSDAWSLWDYAPSALTTLFYGSETPETPVPDPKRRPALLLLGDSITEGGTSVPAKGWVALLQERYNRSVDIDCRGLSGYNTKWCVHHVNPVIQQELQSWLVPSLVTIWFGANDAALLDGPAFRQHVPVADFRANLQAIVAMFKQNAPGAKIIIITPPHVDDSRRVNAQGQHDRTNAFTGQYARACVEEAAKAGVASLDLYSYFNAMPEAKRNGYLSDGLHPNAEGAKIVDEQLRAKIHSAFPDLVPRLEKWQLPDWHVFPDATEEETK